MNDNWTRVGDRGLGDCPEFEIVGQRPERCKSGDGQHSIRVKLSDGTVQDAAEVIAAIDSHTAHYVMRPVEGTPAYQAHQETGLKLLLQVRDCPDCGERVLFA